MDAWDMKNFVMYCNSWVGFISMVYEEGRVFSRVCQFANDALGQVTPFWEEIFLKHK